MAEGMPFSNAVMPATPCKCLENHTVDESVTGEGDGPVPGCIECDCNPRPQNFPSECEMHDLSSQMDSCGVSPTDGSDSTGSHVSSGSSLHKENQFNPSCHEEDSKLSPPADQSLNSGSASKTSPEDSSRRPCPQEDNLVQIFQRAVQADHEHKFQEAISYYRTGLSKFDRYLKEKEQKGCIGPSFSSLRKKYADFLSRCDTIERSSRTQDSRPASLGVVMLSNRQNLSNRASNTKELLEHRNMFLTRPQHKLKDVIGLRSLKLKLTEGIILPLKFPSLFSGSRRRMCNYGHFLFGPPGVGKTRLALAIGAEIEGCTVFHAHVCDFISAYSGGERTVKLLFELAVLHQPSIVIIDEMESFGRREEMLYRRIKTELLVQFHDISQQSVFVIAISNAPWHLDYSVRRRFSYRLFAKPPDGETRYEMLRYFVDSNSDVPHDLTDNDLQELAVRAKGYTGSDLQVIMRSAWMSPVREITQATHFHQVNTTEGGKEVKMYAPCSASAEGAVESTFDKLDLPLMNRPYNMNDMMQALGEPSVSKEELRKYEDYVDQYGHHNPYDDEVKKINEPVSLKELTKSQIQSLIPDRVSLDEVQSLELPRSLLLYVLLRD